MVYLNQPAPALSCRASPILGVSENRGPEYGTLNRRLLIVMDPKFRCPLFSGPPMCNKSESMSFWCMRGLRSLETYRFL